MSGRFRSRQKIIPVQKGPSAKLADFGSGLARVLIAGALVVLCAGCVARPVGDFGRAEPGFTHDVAMPAAGSVRAQIGKEKVSRLNLSDQETEMHDRVWRFLVAPHARDWFYDTAVELQRTRLTGATDLRFAVTRYYDWLKSTAYESSRVRYATLGRHIDADIDTVPTTFAAICAVVEVDRQRAVSERSLAGIEPDVTADVAARKAENDLRISWFVRALNYRYQSYDYALNYLLVETPHEESVAVDQKLRALGRYVAKANRYDFCGGAGGYAGGSAREVIPSRYSHQKVVIAEPTIRK